MAIRKIRNAQDLDIVVTDSLWKQLSGKYPVTNDSFLERIILQEGMDILGKGSMFEDDNIATTEKMIKTADFFEGHRFLNLQLLKAFKLKMGREKDLKDIELIDQYLASQAFGSEAITQARRGPAL